MSATQAPQAQATGHDVEAPADAFVDLRDHRRPREGDDLPLAVPARAARAARLPDRRRRGRRLDGRRAREHARDVDRGAPASSSIDAVFDRFAARLSYVSGDFTDPATYGRVGAAIDGAQTPVFYLEIPPFLFGTVVQGLAEAGLTEGRRASSSRSRSATTSSRRGRSPPSCTSTSTSRSSSASTTSSGRWASTRSLPPLREHDAGADLEPELRRLRADHDGRGLRRRGPRPLLRSGRRAPRRRRQPPDAGRRRDRDGGARRRRPEHAQGREGRASSARSSRPTRRTTCAASTTATSASTASRRTRRTETFAALRLEIDNWRWSGVPFFIRTGKRLPVTQTELRLVFKRAAAARLRARSTAAPEPNQLVIKLDPSTGVRIVLDARRADAEGRGADHARHGVLREGGEGATPYEVLLHAAMVGDSVRFTRQDGVEETWRIMQPLLDSPPPVHPYAPGSWGPAAADALVARPRRLARALGRRRTRTRDGEHEQLRRDHRRHRRRRRHARAAPRPVGQADPPARARRLAAARARELASPRRCSSTTATSRPTPGTTRTARRSSRRSTTSSAARPSSTAPRSTGCARRTSASSAITTASRPPGRSPTTSWSRTTRRPSSSTRCTATAARTRPSRPRARRTRFPAVSHEPRIQQLSDDARGGRLPPVPRALRDHARRGEPAVQRLRALRELRRLPVPRARQVGRRGARRAARRSSIANVTLLTNATSCKLETNDGRHRGDRGRRRARRRRGALRRRRRRRSRAARRTPRSCSCVSASDRHPNGLANGSDQVGRNYMFHNSQAVLALSREENPTDLPEDARAERLLLRRATSDEFPLGNIQMVGKSQAPMFRGEKPVRDEAGARAGRSSGSRSTRSTSGSRPRTCRGPTTASPSTATASVTLAYTSTNDVPKERALRTSSSRCSASST